MKKLTKLTMQTKKPIPEVRKKRVLEMRNNNASIMEISHEVGMSIARVSMAIADARAELNEECKDLVKVLRDKEAAHLQALSLRWLPIAMQPTRMSKVSEIRDGKLEIVDKEVFNPAAAVALEKVIKIKDRFAKLMGLDLQKMEAPQMSGHELFLLIAAMTGSEPRQIQGKTIEAETFGKLAITTEADAL